MSGFQVWPFLAAVALIELTPGPNMGYLALVSMRLGLRAGFATVAGITLGLAAYLVATLLGLAEATLRWPWVYESLRWAGVAYLIWLAWDSWRVPISTSAETSPTAGVGQLFLRGMLNNLLNPKAAVFYVAILPAFIQPERGAPLVQAVMLGAIHLTVAFVVHAGIVLGGAQLKGLLDSKAPSGAGRWIRHGFALALLAVAGWVALSTGR